MEQKQTTLSTTKPIAPPTVVEAPPQCAWGGQDTSTKDMLVPGLLLMQDISDLVKDEKAKSGSIVNSVTGQVLALRDQKLNIVPILTFREWEVNELIEVGGKTKEKFVRRERMNQGNEDGEWEFSEGGKSYRQHRTIVCFVLVEGQIGELPYVIRFKKTSLYGGKKLSTHFQTCGMKNQSPAKQAFGLFGEKQTKNDNTYYVFNVVPTRQTSKEEEAAAYKWWKALSAVDAKIIEADDVVVPF